MSAAELKVVAVVCGFPASAGLLVKDVSVHYIFVCR